MAISLRPDSGKLAAVLGSIEGSQTNKLLIVSTVDGRVVNKVATFYQTGSFPLITHPEGIYYDMYDRVHVTFLISTGGGING